MSFKFPKFFLIFVFLFSPKLQADEVSVFLKSSGYGAAAGAILGLATLAISENPDGKINNVARGASLGLYAGIGFAFYTLNSVKPAGHIDEASFGPSDPQGSQLWISPLMTDEKLKGLQINWANISF